MWAPATARAHQCDPRTPQKATERRETLEDPNYNKQVCFESEECPHKHDQRKTCQCTDAYKFKHALNGYHKGRWCQDGRGNDSKRPHPLSCRPNRFMRVDAACGAGKSLVGVGLAVFFPFAGYRAALGAQGHTVAPRLLFIFQGPRQIYSFMNELGMMVVPAGRGPDVETAGRIQVAEGDALARRPRATAWGFPRELLAELLPRIYHLKHSRTKPNSASKLSWGELWSDPTYRDAWIVFTSHDTLSAALKVQRERIAAGVENPWVVGPEGYFTGICVDEGDHGVNYCNLGDPLADDKKSYGHAFMTYSTAPVILLSATVKEAHDDMMLRPVPVVGPPAPQEDAQG